MAVIFSDNFDRADGALGGSWTTIPSGDVVVSGNQAAALSWDATALYDIGISSGYRVSVTFSNKQWPGLLVRNDGTADYWIVRSASLELLRRQGGATVLATGPTDPDGPLTLWVEVREIAEGTEFIWGYDTTTIGTVVDSLAGRPAGTLVGFLSQPGDRGLVDNFLVEDFVTGPVYTGTGTLSGTGALSGSGTLSEQRFGTGALTGTGTLAGSGEGELGPIFTGTGAFSGTGTITGLGTGGSILPETILPGVSTGHLLHHSTLHMKQGSLPTTIVEGDPDHMEHHNALKVWYDLANPDTPLPLAVDGVSHAQVHATLHTWANTGGAGGGGDDGNFLVGNSILYPNYIGTGSVFQRDVSSMPLAANSGQMASYMRQDQLNTGYSTAFNVYQYNFPTYIVKSSEMEKADVTWRELRNWGWTPVEMMGTVFSKGPHNPELNTPAFAPIPEYAVPATGTDSSMAVYDADTDTLWEWWQIIKTGTRQWAAEWGSRTLHASQKYNGQADVGSVCAAGLMGSLLQIGIGEVQSGAINHALGIIILAPKRGYSWPARQDDGWVDDINAPTQGQWARLNPALDIEAQNWNPLLKMVARAAQTYGMTCFDKGGAVAFSGESGAHQEAETGTNPWPALITEFGGGLPEWEVFAQFPWEQTQWAPLNWGKP